MDSEIFWLRSCPNTYPQTLFGSSLEYMLQPKRLFLCDACPLVFARCNSFISSLMNKDVLRNLSGRIDNKSPSHLRAVAL